MADFEDANTPTWHNMVQGQVNLVDAVARTIEHRNPDGRVYRLNEQIATLLVRPRGWHLPERHLQVSRHSHLSSEIVEGSQWQHAQTLSGSGKFTGDSVDGPVTAERQDQVRPRVDHRNAMSDCRIRRSKPPAFFAPECSELIRLGNLDDHLSRLSEADWIIEAVTENLEIKEGVLKRIETVRKAGAIVSSNTSGIPIHRLSLGLSEDFRRHWLGTHFFNPPRYMKLLEVIPTAETLPAVVQTIAEIGDRLAVAVQQRAASRDAGNAILRKAYSIASNASSRP
jgi:GNAT superfamily N-acetyltransferase